MAGWHHRPDAYEFEQAPGVGDGQGSLACCNPWGCKELDMTEQLNWTELNFEVESSENQASWLQAMTKMSQNSKTWKMVPV